MSDAPTRFYDVCAAFYDGDYDSAGYEHDIPFYVGLAEEAVAAEEAAARAPEGAALLEMGCGTGRVLIPTARALAATGARVTLVGVDASAGMLERCAARLARESDEVRSRVRLERGDITSVDLRHHAPDGFALVTAPFRVVHHLAEPGAVRAWLRNAARHLVPDGRLCFDVFQPDYAQVADDPSTSVDIEREDPATGRTVRRVATCVHHPEEQTFEVEFEWLLGPAPGADGESGEDETIEAGDSLLRWFTRHELELLLEIEGFEVTDAWGDFERTPFGEGDEAPEAIVLRARRADP